MKSVMRFNLLMTMAAALSLLGAAPVTFAGGGTTLSPDPCASLLVSTNPQNINQAGGTFTINSSVTNCSAQIESVTAYFSFSGTFGLSNDGCLSPLSPYAVTLTLKPGETRGFSFNEPVPDLCEGLYGVTGTVVLNTADPSQTPVLATNTAWFSYSVQPQIHRKA